jgi:hypothetical protein
MQGAKQTKISDKVADIVGEIWTRYFTEHPLQNFHLRQSVFYILYYPSHNTVLYQQVTRVTFTSRLISTINAPR